ncbi:MAG: hypothetical protein IPL89_17460 [Acidobacteria bacterium]|nr:hypothetical protein [Acidobacteriota bacterium]
MPKATPRFARFVVFPAALVALISAEAARGAAPSGIVTQAELSAGGKKQAKEKFRLFPPDAKIRLADGRVLTKAELEAAGRRKPKPDVQSAAPAAGAEASQLAKLNAELATRSAAKLQVDGAKLQEAFRRVSTPFATKPDPPQPDCPAPKVDSVFPLSNITPGGWVMVAGCGFTATPGQFVLVLSKTNQQIPVGSLQWSPKGVAGQIPADHPAFKTATTQPAILQVKTQVGTGTSPFITYRAGREVVLLPFKDYVGIASTESDDDRCVDVWGKAQCEHYTGPWDPLGGDGGVDKFSVTLHNGWVIHSWELVRGAGSTNWFMTSHKGAGTSHATHEVSWLTLCGDGCHCYYWLKVFVEGEIGTKWK